MHARGEPEGSPRVAHPGLNPSDDWPTSGDEPVDDDDDREHEEQMDQPTANMEREGAEQPEDEQNDRES
jgi:hypothetical protein